MTPDPQETVQGLLTAARLAAGNSPNAAQLYDDACRVIGHLLHDRDEWRKAAYSATPGGSEFCNPGTCADHIWQLRRDLHDARVALVMERRKNDTKGHGDG